MFQAYTAVILGFLLCTSVRAADDCERFNHASAADKMETILGSHANSVLGTWVKSHGGGGDNAWEGNAIARGGGPRGYDIQHVYVKDYIGRWFFNRSIRDEKAIEATATFLAPDINNQIGFRNLRPTFTRACEIFSEAEVKKVHALGTLAFATMRIFPKLKVLGDGDVVQGEVENPWSGLLDPQKNGNGVPLFVRFSIANPVAHTLKVHGRSLLLEFIPGVGFKFLIDGRRSVDLVAMDSLAGQGSDQNFFKYEFSPDFSANAPEAYNTAIGPQKQQIMARYEKNPANHHVMGLVGERFAQVIPLVSPGAVVAPHSALGPHPFIMSIAALAAVDRTGAEIPANDQKRPWRLVFKPVIDSQNRANVLDKTAYVPGKLTTDYRYKLAYLQPGDRLFEVIGETQSKQRYLAGEIVLQSPVTPSEYADQLYFVQHQLEMARISGETIVDPGKI